MLGRIALVSAAVLVLGACNGENGEAPPKDSSPGEGSLPDGFVPSDGADGDGGGGGLTAAEIAECKKNVLEAAQGTSSSHGNYVGGFQEVAGTRDPTGGLIIASLPLQDGPIYGQMVNTYLDCTGNLGTGGTYKGDRAGTTLSGSWTMRQLAGTFGGSWTATAKDNNRLVDGTYSVGSGPTTSMDCMNPDGTQFGVDNCYCASPGSFTLVKEGETPAAKSIPFTVDNSTQLTLKSEDNPATTEDESTKAQRYAIIDAELVCSNELPVIALCLNVLNLNPMEVKHTANCEVQLPLTTIDPIQVGLCPCLFLSPLVKGKWYIAVGINSASGNAGLSFDDLEVVSFQSFQY
jgi:hypothetical protein